MNILNKIMFYVKDDMNRRVNFKNEILLISIFFDENILLFL